ncbi:MAG: hypothetical protein ACLUC1_04025 [Enterococcus gallinarum]
MITLNITTASVLFESISLCGVWWFQSSPQQALPQPIMTSGPMFSLAVINVIGVCRLNGGGTALDHYAIKTGYPRVEKNDSFRSNDFEFC